ncbi:MAG: Trk family potassium uptake protein [Oscillospiraceae bacterium]|nr:Trk family potassium uptake protein [Oscillospiraceae bacterium]
MTKKPKLSSVQVIALGFLLMILGGAVLLSLPAASAAHTATPFGDCLFTATSASCVTGLIVRDTATHWSLFGQIVLLVLIQIGGLGFMSVSALFLLMMRRRIGLRFRVILVDSINYSQIGDILPFLRRILLGAFMFEGIGAVLLAFRFIPLLGVPRGIYYSIFHAITAFCNAGFDLMGSVSGEYSSLVMFSGDWLVNLTICALILIGALGFWVWSDLWNRKLRIGRCSLHTKLTLAVSAVLVIGGTLLFRLLEHANFTAAGMPEHEKWLCALFDAVTPRTAGFNTTDTAGLSDGSMLLTYLLMFIGGGSGSTAGGMKMTTVAVMLLFVIAGIRNQEEATAFGRTIPVGVLRSAATVISMNAGLALTGAVIICAADGLPLRDVLFETISAVSTVGMTTGITRDLGTVSRITIIILMYLGRVGSVSFALAMIAKRHKIAVKLPTETVQVG